MKRVLVVLAVLLVVVVIALAGSTRASEGARTINYSSSRSKVRIPNTLQCATVSINARIRSLTSPSGLLGWSGATVSNEVVRAMIEPCTQGQVDAVSRLRVTQTWTAQSCRLDAEGDQELVDDELGGWRTKPGDCNRAAVGLATAADSSSLTWTTDDPATFRGRTWASRLCLDVVVYVEANVRDEVGVASAGVLVPLEPACLRR